MSVRRSLLVLTVLMFTIPAAVFAYQANQRTAAADNAVLYETHIVQRNSIEAVVSAIGTIEADQVITLSFLTQGRVAEVFVEMGTFVMAGDPLVRLESDSQNLALEQAVVARDRAQLALDELLAPVDEDDIRLAEANVDSAWGRYLSAENAISEDDIRAAELSYQQAYEVYETLRAARDQAPGGYGGPAYNALDAQTGAASFDAEIARLRLEDLRTGTSPQRNSAYASVVLAQRQLDQLLAGPPQSQIDAAALDVRRAEAALTRAENALTRMTLVAPQDGVVSGLLVEVGTWVVPGLNVIEVTDLSPLRLTVQVDEIDIRLVGVGMTARVAFDALRDVVVPAQVETIALLGNNVNGIVNYDVDLTLQDPDARVRVGMTAEASIVTAARDAVLTVPNLYIRLDRRLDRAFVNRLNADGSIQEVEITLGVQGQNSSEVLAGLAEGDVIAVDPSGGLSLFGE